MKKIALILVIAIMLSMIVSCTIPKDTDSNSNDTSSDKEISENSNNSSTESEISEDISDETSDDDKSNNTNSETSDDNSDNTSDESDDNEPIEYLEGVPTIIQERITLLGIKDNWHFFIGSDKRIYKERLDTLEKQCITDDKAISAALHGDWIYFSNESDGKKLYKVRTDGKERQKFFDVASKIAYSNGEWVVYYNEIHEKFYTVKTDGTKNHSLLDDEIRYTDLRPYYTFADEYLYYRNERDNSTLYSIKIDGTEIKQLVDYLVVDITVIDDWIYYCNDTMDWSLWRVKRDGSENQRITNHRAQHYQFYDDFICYMNYHDEESRWRINYDGTGDMKLPSSPEKNFPIIGHIGDTFFYIYAEEKMVYRTNLDGTNKEELQGVPSGDWVLFYKGWLSIKNENGSYYYDFTSGKLYSGN